ncbi:hypothetical protein AAAC51_29060 [Priestia megaterium]
MSVVVSNWGVNDCEKGAGAVPAPVPGVKVEGETDPRMPFCFSRCSACKPSCIKEI